MPQSYHEAGTEASDRPTRYMKFRVCNADSSAASAGA